MKGTEEGVINYLAECARLRGNTFLTHLKTLKDKVVVITQSEPDKKCAKALWTYQRGCTQRTPHHD